MDSNALRLWILFIGTLLIAGIYGWDKWHERRSNRESEDEETAKPSTSTAAKTPGKMEAIPILTERYSAAKDEAIGARENAPNATTKPAAFHGSNPSEPPKEMLLAFSILAQRGREFTGGELAQALRKAGMVYGTMKIFHAPADLERPDGPALYSLANMLEPGTLEPERLRLLATPGVVLFAQLPGPVTGVQVLELMQATGRFLAKELRGDLCDERRQPLTAEKIEELRSRILTEIGDTVRKPDFD